jgi:hypothetical protein
MIKVAFTDIEEDKTAPSNSPVIFDCMSQNHKLIAFDGIPTSMLYKPWLFGVRFTIMTMLFLFALDEISFGQDFEDSCFISQPLELEVFGKTDFRTGNDVFRLKHGEVIVKLTKGPASIDYNLCELQKVFNSVDTLSLQVFLEDEILRCTVNIEFFKMYELRPWKVFI